MVNKRAFSLIELMVVIAIVAILAAVAVPAYKTYITKTKLSGVSTTAFGIVNQAKIYYNQTASFPTLKQMGYTTAPASDIDSPNATTPNDVAPNVPFVSFNPVTGNTCSSGVLVFYIAGLDPSNNTIPDYMNGGGGTNYSGTGYGLISIVDVNGTIKNFCEYSLYGSNNEFINGDYMSGCTNYADDPSITATITAALSSC